jgi:ADP-ribosylglycohydrolase
VLGAIVGDIVGSIYEHDNIKSKNFPLFAERATFTDDTVCTVAIADGLLSSGDFAGHLRTWVRRYPHAGYGGMFLRWAFADDRGPYGSWGNGSAMRVSPVAHSITETEAAMLIAERTAIVTHDHPEAVHGAQAVTMAIRLALQGQGRDQIRNAVEQRFGYDLSETMDSLRSWYAFDVSCRGTVPPAIICALASNDFEDALRNAVSIGGDTDTIACITGGIAEAMHGIPRWIVEEGLARLDDDLRDVVERFRAVHIPPPRHATAAIPWQTER